MRQQLQQEQVHTLPGKRFYTTLKRKKTQTNMPQISWQLPRRAELATHTSQLSLRGRDPPHANCVTVQSFTNLLSVPLPLLQTACSRTADTPGTATSAWAQQQVRMKRRTTNVKFLYTKLPWFKEVVNTF